MLFPAKPRFPYAYVIVSILGIQDILFIVCKKHCQYI